MVPLIYSSFRFFVCAKEKSIWGKKCTSMPSCVWKQYYIFTPCLFSTFKKKVKTWKEVSHDDCSAAKCCFMQDKKDKKQAFKDNGEFIRSQRAPSLSFSHSLAHSVSLSLFIFLWPTNPQRMDSFSRMSSSAWAVIGPGKGVELNRGLQWHSESLHNRQGEWNNTEIRTWVKTTVTKDIKRWVSGGSTGSDTHNFHAKGSLHSAQALWKLSEAWMCREI